VLRLLERVHNSLAWVSSTWWDRNSGIIIYDGNRNETT
jgi:hypothetical protein